MTILTINTHLILVSAQAVPNITPVLDERFKPHNVVLLVSPDMAYRAECLEKIYSKRGVKSERCQLKDAWDIEHIRQQASDPILSDLIHLFAKNNLISLDKNMLVFPTEEARFYVNGGWLEQHVWGVCLNIKKQSGIQDIGRSVQVERQHQNKPVRNELDITFLKDNRLYIIECKTQKFNAIDESAGSNSQFKTIYFSRYFSSAHPA